MTWIRLEHSVAPIEVGRPLRLLDFTLTRDRRLPLLARVRVARWRRKHPRVRELIALRRANAKLDELLEQFDRAAETITNPARLLKLLG